MAVVYFDSSAFVKLLVEESGADVAAALWDRCDVPVSSRLAYPEVRAALAAAARAGRIDAIDERAAEAALSEFWAATRVVELSAAIAESAGELARDYALRGADAIHLASVLALQPDAVLAAWDERLLAAAEAAGVSVVSYH